MIGIRKLITLSAIGIAGATAIKKELYKEYNIPHVKGLSVEKAVENLKESGFSDVDVLCDGIYVLEDNYSKFVSSYTVPTGTARHSETVHIIAEKKQEETKTEEKDGRTAD